MAKAKTLQTPWYDKTVKALQLAGMGDRTQECYARAVRKLLEFHEKDPRKITEGELKEYLLYRRNESNWAPATMRICYCGLKFFFIHVLGRKWPLFEYLKAQKESRLPSVLTPEEVRLILSQVRTFHNYAFLVTVYTCGLRLQEALFLQVSDIDGKRMMTFLCDPPAGGGRKPARHPALPGSRQARNHHGLPASYPERPGGCFPDHQPEHEGFRKWPPFRTSFVSMHRHILKRMASGCPGTTGALSILSCRVEHRHAAWPSMNAPDAENTTIFFAPAATAIARHARIKRPWTGWIAR